MIYIPQLDESYPSIEDYLHDIVRNTSDPEYAECDLHDAVSEVFPDINYDNLDIDYNCWQEREGPYAIRWDYQFSFNETEFKEKYPEFYI